MGPDTPVQVRLLSFKASLAWEREFPNFQAIMGSEQAWPENSDSPQGKKPSSVSRWLRGQDFCPESRPLALCSGPWLRQRDTGEAIARARTGAPATSAQADTGSE